MYNTTTRFPKSNTIFCRGSAQEIINLTVHVLRLLKVLTGSHFSFNKMITVNCAGHCNLKNTQKKNFVNFHVTGYKSWERIKCKANFFLD